MRPAVVDASADIVCGSRWWTVKYGLTVAAPDSTTRLHPPGRRLLRVAMASHYLPSNSKIGVGYQAHGLANALVDRGHHVTLFSPASTPPGARYEHLGRPLEGRQRMARWARMVADLDLRDYDVFHAHGDDYLRVRGPRHVRTMHGSCFAEARHIRGARERARMLALGAGEIVSTIVANRTVAVSSNTRAWYPWIRDVIPNGVDTEVFAPRGDREAVPTVLFVGTFRHRKRGQLLAAEFERVVRPAIRDARLWMVCDDAPARPGIEVLGRLSDEELAERYRRAWVFCLPSSYEGFGVPYIEALASGTPVVASPNPGALEVLESGRLGRIVADDALGRALVDLLRDPLERERLSRLGIERAARYAWPVIAGRYEDLYWRVLGVPA